MMLLFRVVATISTKDDDFGGDLGKKLATHETRDYLVACEAAFVGGVSGVVIGYLKTLREFPLNAIATLKVDQVNGGYDMSRGQILFVAADERGHAAIVFRQ